MPGHAGSRPLTSSEWARLREDMKAQTLVLGCPSSDADFVLTTGLFATWVAETLGQIVPAEDPPLIATRGWFSRILRALVWSVRHERAIGLAVSEPHEDADVWNHILTVQDAVPIFFEVSKRDAERIQHLAMGKSAPSAANLDQARRAFLQKVVPALNAVYRTEN